LTVTLPGKWGKNVWSGFGPSSFDDTEIVQRQKVEKYNLPEKTTIKEPDPISILVGLGHFFFF